MLRSRILLTLLAGLGTLLAQAGELVVATSQANLRAGATVGQPVLEVVMAGERLQPMQYRNGYVQVRRAAGSQGWIHAAGQGWTEAQVRAALEPTASGVVAHTAQAQDQPPGEPMAGPQGAPNYPLSLAALGMKQGHFFEGARSLHSQVFYFPLPRDGGLKHGVLRLHFRASGQINPLSTLRVDINDQPARTVSLGNREAPAWLEVPVTAADLAKAALKVTVRASLVASVDRCFDERSLALFFVQLMPDSRLDLDLGPGEDSLRAAWSHLPDRVRISVPGEVGDAVYAATLEAAVLLQRARRQVEVVNLPQVGDIVIAPEAELARLFAEAGQTRIVAGDDKLNAVRVFHQADGHQVIALSDRLDTRLLSRDAPAWRGLLKADAYRAQAPDVRAGESLEALNLRALGLEATQYVNRTVEWSALLTPPIAPAGKWLDTLRLNVVAPPASVAGKMLLYVYLNGTLQEVRQLDADGEAHIQSFDLRRTSQRVGANHLRIVVQRVAEEGECRGDVVSFPIQFLPGTVLSLKEWHDTPIRFDDLRATFSQAPELWLAPGSQARLGREIGMLSGLFVNHAYPFDRGRLHFISDKTPLAPQGPFVLFGATDRGPSEVAVHLDRGRVRVLDGQNQTLLDVERLPAISVAQLVKHGGQHGLWLAPAREGALPPATELFLNQDDVAFLDEQGVALTLASRQHALAHAEYPDYLSWLDLAERYRFWIIGLGWTLLAVFLLHLYRKSRKHAGR